MNVRVQTDVLRLPFVLTRPVHSNVTVEKGFRSTPLVDHAKARCNAYTYLSGAIRGLDTGFKSCPANQLDLLKVVPGSTLRHSQLVCHLPVGFLFELCHCLSLAMKSPRELRVMSYTHIQGSARRSTSCTLISVFLIVIDYCCDNIAMWRDSPACGLLNFHR